MHIWIKNELKYMIKHVHTFIFELKRRIPNLKSTLLVLSGGFVCVCRDMGPSAGDISINEVRPSVWICMAYVC